MRNTSRIATVLMPCGEASTKACPAWHESGKHNNDRANETAGLMAFWRFHGNEFISVPMPRPLAPHWPRYFFTSAACGRNWRRSAGLALAVSMYAFNNVSFCAGSIVTLPPCLTQNGNSGWMA